MNYTNKPVANGDTLGTFFANPSNFRRPYTVKVFGGVSGNVLRR
jgi:hypothetical protein